MLPKRNAAPEQHDWTYSYSEDAAVIAEVDAVVYDNIPLALHELADVRRALCAPAIQTEIGARVLVPACGTGRHVLPLAQAGHTVFGIDLSREFLRRATRRTNGVVTQPSYRVWDMAKPFPMLDWFDTCLLLGGSFGYRDDLTNKHTLYSLYHSLCEGGSLVFDVTDPAYAREMAEKRPYSSEYVDTPTFGRVLDERERRWINAEQCMVSRKRHIQADTGTVLLDLEYRIKIYEFEQLHAWLEEAGFTTIHLQQATSDNSDMMGLMAGRWVIAAR